MGNYAYNKTKIMNIGHSLICLYLLFGFGYLPAFGALNTIGMKVLGVFLGMLYGWTFIGFIWPSMIGIIALGLSGYATIPAIVSKGFGDITVTVLVLCMMVFARYLDNAGVSGMIANWFISRKINVGHPWIFTSMFLLVPLVLAALTGVFPAILLSWDIFYKICQKIGYRPRDKYPVLMLIGVVFAAMMGYGVLPFKNAVTILALKSFEMSSNGLEVDYGRYTLIAAVIVLISFTLYIMLMKYIFRPDMRPFVLAGDFLEEYRDQTITLEQKIGLVFLLIFLLVMFLPSFSFIAATRIGAFFKTLGAGGTVFVTLALLAFVKIEGKAIFDFQECAKGINWEMIIMFVATMPMANALSADEVGVMNFIVESLTPLFAHMSPLMFSIVFLLIAGLITQVAHNLVLAVLLTPIMCNFAISLGADPVAMVILFSYIIGLAVATPGGSAMGALVYLNTEWIGTKNAYKYCCVVAGITILVSIGIGLPVCALIL